MSPDTLPGDICAGVRRGVAIHFASHQAQELTTTWRATDYPGLDSEGDVGAQSISADAAASQD